jgi:hypothetical protein
MDMLLFVNGLLSGLLFCCILVIYANAIRPRKSRNLPADRHWTEYKDGSVSFAELQGFQNIPCRIEIYHTSRWSYNERVQPIEKHTEVRRYKLNVVLPTALTTLDKTFFKLIDSDGVALAAYIGSSDTLIQA